MHKTFSNISLKGLGEVVDYLISLISEKHNVVKLYGDLGAGKTTFVRALIRSLSGQDERVISPTFNLVQLYETPKGKVWHYDLYRVEDASELEELALEEALEDVLIIEWPQIADKYLPEEAISVTIEFTQDMKNRNFTIKNEA